jgi:hypothetical protein
MCRRLGRRSSAVIAVAGFSSGTLTSVSIIDVDEGGPTTANAGVGTGAAVSISRSRSRRPHWRRGCGSKIGVKLELWLGVRSAERQEIRHEPTQAATSGMGRVGSAG